MYRLLKSKGNNGTISVENVEKKAYTVIGRLTTRIITILDEAGVSVGTEEIKYTDEWDMPISSELATKLLELAMPIKKPIRDQRKKPPKIDNKHIDAMDVLLGLAQYN